MPPRARGSGSVSSGSSSLLDLVDLQLLVVCVDEDLFERRALPVDDPELSRAFEIEGVAFLSLDRETARRIHQRANTTRDLRANAIGPNRVDGDPWVGSDAPMFFLDPF